MGRFCTCSHAEEDHGASCDLCHCDGFQHDPGPAIVRWKRHCSTLAAILSGVAVDAVLDERLREIRDTIKQELEEL